MPELSHDGVRLHYAIDGAGPPVMLIAGTASDGASWGPLVGPLSERYTVIRPDNRTTGQTVPADAPVSMGHWVGDLAALIDGLGLGPVAVVGHSLGGQIGLELAHAHPGKVTSLSLLAAAPLPLARNRHLFDLLLRLRHETHPPDLWLRAFYPWLFHHSFFDDPETVANAIALGLAYPHAQPASQMARQLAAAQDHRMGEDVTGIACPCLAVLAQNDLLIPRADAAAALSAIAGVTIRTVPEAGHSVHWDAPDAVMAHLAPFLAANRP